MSDQPTPPPVPHMSREVMVYLLTTIFAGSLNMLIALLLGIFVLPAIRHNAEESRRVREEIRETRLRQEAVNADLETHRQAIKRFNTAVETWEAILKKAKAKKK